MSLDLLGLLIDIHLLDGIATGSGNVLLCLSDLQNLSQVLNLLPSMSCECSNQSICKELCLFNRTNGGETETRQTFKLDV